MGAWEFRAARRLRLVALRQRRQQIRFVLHALEQRDGADLLSAPEVTTLSGRQTQIQVVDVRSIVVGNQTQFGGGGGGGVAAGGLLTGTQTGQPGGFQPQTASVPLGPILVVD